MYAIYKSYKLYMYLFTLGLDRVAYICRSRNVRLNLRCLTPPPPPYLVHLVNFELLI